MMMQQGNNKVDVDLESTLPTAKVSSSGSARFDIDEDDEEDNDPNTMTNGRRSSSRRHSTQQSRRRSSTAVHPTHQQQLYQRQRQSSKRISSYSASSSMHFWDLQDASHVFHKENAANKKKNKKKHDGSSGNDGDKDAVILNANDFESSQPSSSSSWIQKILCAMGMILGLVLCFTTIDNNREINQTLAIAVWMATLWVTEVIPLVVTAFLPLVLFPLFGILSSGTVAVQYMNNTIWLLISGFFMALTLERWNLHRRFSLKVLTWCGTRPQWLLGGMMGATFFLSMFVSNTATTLMMVPNALSVCTALERSSSSSQSKTSTEIAGSDDSNDDEEEEGDSSEPTDLERHNLDIKSKKFAVAMMLGIAYSANVGGMSSLIGTPPNLVFQRQLELLFPDAPEMTFSQWLGFGLPVGLTFFLIIWVYLCLVYLRDFTKKDSQAVDPDLFVNKYQSLGPWNREQMVTTLAFCTLCLLWLFRADLNFGSFTIKGWSSIFPEPSYISDATTGMAIAFLLFICPARSTYLALEDEDDEIDDDSNGDNEYDPIIEEAPLLNQEESQNETDGEPRVSTDTTILDWDTANKIPYDVIFLLGGGFALAKGFVESGLSQYLGNILAGIDITLPAMVFVLVTLIIWLTELTSNTSTADIMILIAASLAVANKVSPYTYMIPATMACSCAFVLPIATPPNMVVFSTGRLPMREMNKAGVLLNIIGSLLLLGAAFTIIPAVLDVEADEYPAWAETSTLNDN